MATPKTTASKTSAHKTGDLVVQVGSTAIQPVGRHGSAAPAGMLHLVDGWDALCGGGRVRFVFPGQAAAEGTCPECVKATATKPRPGARSRARAS